MHVHTHRGLERIEWPDGRCYLQQYALLIDVWDVLGEELAKHIGEQSRRKQGV